MAWTSLQRAVLTAILAAKQLKKLFKLQTARRRQLFMREAHTGAVPMAARRFAPPRGQRPGARTAPRGRPFVRRAAGDPAVRRFSRSARPQNWA